MERPMKRRRLSLEEGDGSSVSDSDGSSQDERNERAAAHHTLDTTSVSRIKPKTPITNSAPIPDTLREAIDSSIAPNSKATFSSLGIVPWLTHSLSALSITAPTRIQTQCIPSILNGNDCIGSSRTGSGKTLAFALPILQKWAESPSSIFAVILTPTRELALQIYEQVVALGSGQGLKVALVTGGADRGKQAGELEERPGVVVATPGRLADFVLNEGEGSEIVRSLGRVKVVVLDEGDRLLASGPGSMVEDLETCFSAFPPPEERQTLLFTATVTTEVRAMKSAPRAKGKREVFMYEVDTKALAVPQTLKQTYQLVNVLHKEKYLHILLLTPTNLKRNIIIFCNRTSTATLLEYMLRLLEHRVTSLHSGLQHKERVANLAKFRARVARILIATDLASRGLDIPSVELVVNYDLPRNPEDYIHRVGRTARAARKGTSISLVGQRDVELVHAIEARVGGQMEEYAEEGVNVEGRVVREAINLVSEKKREAMLNLEEGRDVRGKRQRGEMRKKGR